MKLTNKVALVTGGASGFGQAICEKFAQEGASVLVVDINGQGAEKVAQDIGGRAWAFQADVSKECDVQRLFAQVREQLGTVDILVNNAGVTHPRKALEAVTEAEFDRVFSINVKSMFFTAKYAVPMMRASGGGVIINTASTAASRPRPGLTWYNTSKGAVVTMTKSMAAELAQDNIRVCALNPVIGETGMLEEFMGKPDTPENRQAFLDTIPLGRFLKPVDVAKAALFLASEEASMVTGVDLEVDGGRCI
ncbi:glucose 1-dehydrogenase [Vibrio sp. Isolate23]|uniref:glucose 1-dehydrogenase n=1 Tax=Vibrio sp. Isolate23 TaxID=2908533 RepID=UPI001EFD3B46|nr:glucose 1-dehydrogenase [Vibrio sp. Isolate23]MCG9681829.1 glucose 1-dehydrogenase [Vibrio sp. Isolate23]